jgi:hypothetical protein
MQAPWQKALIEKEPHAPFAHLTGKEIWIVAEPDLVQDIGKHKYELIILASNLQLSPLEPTKGFGCIADNITLLARGPEDFAEDVEMVPRAVWDDPNWPGCGAKQEDTR